VSNSALSAVGKKINPLLRSTDVNDEEGYQEDSKKARLQTDVRAQGDEGTVGLHGEKP